MHQPKQETKVDYLDMSIGRIFDYLKQQGMYDNTMILFSVRHGVMAAMYPGNADGKYWGSFNNSLENRGLPDSFIEMGPGWAQASSSPFRLSKGNWKILRLAKPFGTGEWQLYNLEKDPGETYDLSQQFAAKRDSLILDWMQYAKENNVVDHHGYYDSLLLESLTGNH